MTPRYQPEDDMRIPTAMRWIDTSAAAGTSAKLPCPICNGQGWLQEASAYRQQRGSGE